MIFCINFLMLYIIQNGYLKFFFKIFGHFFNKAKKINESTSKAQFG